MSLCTGRSKIRYGFFITAVLILPLCGAVPVWAGPVTLWQQGAVAVNSMLPDDWRKMAPAELTAMYQDNRAIIPDQSGTLVAGFSPGSRERGGESSYILILIKSGERVLPEMIQKTYVWLQKNNELVKSMLPDNVKAMHIENIEYRQDLPSIFFQTRLDMGEAVFVGVSATFFLNNSYMNVVCMASERNFADYKGIFLSFINRISIPDSLRYAAGPDSSSAAGVITRSLAWLQAHVKPLLGVVMLVGVYIFVLRISKGKRLKE